jgi:NDP-sugar pyrophosphorylase family protein
VNGIKNMNLILTMAGKYSRFVNEGYKIPKYLLPWKNHTILSEILLNFTKNNIFENIFLIANKKDSDFMNQILHTMKHYNIQSKNLIFINDTKSQCETALISINKFSDKISTKDPICFHNIDTILYERNFEQVYEYLAEYDGYIDTFTSNNHEYSYILKDQAFVRDMQEKILISSVASSGFYGFSNVDMFVENYKNDYFSSVYRSMISNCKRTICGNLHDENDTLVLGTPKDYFDLSAKY